MTNITPIPTINVSPHTRHLLCELAGVDHPYPAPQTGKDRVLAEAEASRSGLMTMIQSKTAILTFHLTPTGATHAMHWRTR